MFRRAIAMYPRRKSAFIVPETGTCLLQAYAENKGDGAYAAANIRQVAEKGRLTFGTT
jgi:hypothetical protein